MVLFGQQFFIPVPCPEGWVIIVWGMVTKAINFFDPLVQHKCIPAPWQGAGYGHCTEAPDCFVQMLQWILWWLTNEQGWLGAQVPTSVWHQFLWVPLLVPISVRQFFWQGLINAVTCQECAPQFTTDFPVSSSELFLIRRDKLMRVLTDESEDLIISIISSPQANHGLTTTTS